ncbi:MAG: hypothetical protein ACI9LG_002693 [Moritella dasanensis]
MANRRYYGRTFKLRKVEMSDKNVAFQVMRMAIMHKYLPILVSILLCTLVAGLWTALKTTINVRYTFGYNPTKGIEEQNHHFADHDALTDLRV